MANILIVCTGNICRSPMAQGLLRELLAERGLDEISVSSAGTSAWGDGEATPEAVEALRERGIDISGHTARRLRRSMVDSADLVIGMTGDHRDAAARMVPDAADRTFTMKELVQLLDDAGEPAGSHPEERLRNAVAQAAKFRARPGWTPPADEDIADPLGLGLESFRASAWEIGGLAERFVASVFDGAAPAVREAKSGGGKNE